MTSATATSRARTRGEEAIERAVAVADGRRPPEAPAHLPSIVSDSRT